MGSFLFSTKKEILTDLTDKLDDFEPEITFFTRHFFELLVIALAMFTLFGAYWWWSKVKNKRKINLLDHLVVAYLSIICVLHMSFDVFWLWNHGNLISKRSTWMFLGDLGTSFWGEFGKSDIRYLTSNELVMAIQFMAVYICLPLAAATLLGYVLNKKWRILTQIVWATAEMYGVLVTIPTAYFVEIETISPVNSFVLHIGYFWITKLLMVVVPFMVLLRAYKWIMSKVEDDENQKGGKKAD